ncbi:MAG: polyphenol oxidase family protein [Bdellovibrionales bacterium]|nr:polyphenol oxidase family protein [Bdellovibrionales bacterium]
MIARWEPAFLENVYLGETLRYSEYQIFFGSAESTYSRLQTTFPANQWARVKQVHGNQLLNCQTPNSDWTNPTSEADGIITSTRGLAAAILTADCLPLMVWDERRKVVGSVHAGWKGIANRIIPECAKELIRTGSSSADLSWWIGPHIQEQSFEVGQDVGAQLVQSAPDGKQSLRSHPTAGKVKINLSVLATQQIQEFGKPKNIWISPIDTFTDLRYASFRRESKQGSPSSARQISFILKR